MIRLSVNINQETAEALQSIATTHGCSYTEAVRRCIAISAYVHEENAAGRRVLSDDGSGNDQRELVLL